MAELSIGLAVLIGAVVFLFFILLPLFALIDVVRSRFRDSSDKLIWVLIILFLPFLGAILYFILGISQKEKKI